MPERREPPEDKPRHAERPEPAAEGHDDDLDSHEGRRRLLRLGRRLLDRGDEVGRAVLETSDRAKTEMVRMVAREVRTYLDELKLKDDLLDLATSHSLELSVSVSLKPLSESARRRAATAATAAEPDEEGVDAPDREPEPGDE
jgi:hypothetical protein